ncbi:MAG: hypothetical protein JW843_00935 [Candidatus Aminicenantes bacterium]|nr:hypothetical protein [Candidatus Aminicenantes bacterium]
MNSTKNKRGLGWSVGLLLTAAAALAAGFPACAPQDLDAAGVVARCAEAMGGFDRIENVQTMRFEYFLPDHGPNGMTSSAEIARPNLMRFPNNDLVYDGRRACFLLGSNGEGKQEFLDEGELTHFETEPALYFPAFFDRPADLLGKTLFRGIEVYHLVVALPRGVEMNYYLDAKTFLPVMAVGRFEFMGKAGEWSRELSDYRMVDGFLVAHAYTYPARKGGTETAKVIKVEINTVDKTAFVIPDGGGAR